MSSMPPARRLPPALLHSLLLVGLIFFTYRSTLTFNFVWDDFLFVEENRAVQSWQYLGDAFTSPQTTWSSDPAHTLPAWRPVRNISFLIDHTLYGLNPTGWHLTNVILHAIAAVLLYFLIRRLILLAGTAPAASSITPTAAGLAALIGAAFWAIHPVQTEVVAWVKSRDDLLAAVFFIATLLVALPRTSRSQLSTINGPLSTDPPLKSPSVPPSPLSVPRSSPSLLRSAFSVLLFVCALLSKENTIILAALYPIILLLLFPSGLRAFASKFALPTAPTAPQLSTLNSSTPSNPRREATPQFIIHNSSFIIPTILLAITAAAFLVVRHLILGRTGQSEPLAGTAANTLYTMLAAFARYIQLILWPWPPTIQSADYDAYPIITTPLHPATLTGAAILLSLLLLFLATSRNCVKKLNLTPTPSTTLNSPPSSPPHAPQAPFSPSHLLTFSPTAAVPRLTAIAIAILLVALLPFANIIPMMQILAERFLYLPLIGPALLLATLAHRSFSSHSRFYFLLYPFSVLLFCALAAQTTRRLPVWQNDIALFSSTLRTNPHSWRPPNNLAKALLKYGHTTPALHVITPALRQFPRDADIVRTAAIVHLLAGHETSGTQLTQYAIQLDPTDPRASKTLELYSQLKAKNQLP